VVGVVVEMVAAAAVLAVSGQELACLLPLEQTIR